MKMWSVRKSGAMFLVAAIVSAVSCGGGDQMAGGGIGGTGITSGTVTGFGSVFVNGVEFQTDGAIRVVDDSVSVSTGSDDASVLSQGMVVKVSGTVNPDRVTGTATRIEYDVLIQGPVKNPPVENLDMTRKSLEIFDATVIAGLNSTVYVNTDYASLGQDRVLEVSGFVDTAGNYLATLIRDKGALGPASEMQLKGTVDQFNGIDSFMLGTIRVDFSGSTVFDNLPGTVANGQQVEVNGLLTDPVTIAASRIQLEDPVFDFDGDASIEGIVSGYAGIGSFRVSGQLVDATSAVFVPAQLASSLDNDQLVEVEGVLNAGVLQAMQVEQRSGNVEVTGRVVSVDAVNSTLAVEVVSGQPSVQLHVDSRSQLEDEQHHVSPFTLYDMQVNDEVIVEGYQDASGVAVRQLERKVITGHYQLQGPVDAAGGTTSSGTVTILGVTIATDAATDFEDANDQPFANGGDDFYSQVMTGDIVRMEDNVPVDGIADEIEFE